MASGWRSSCRSNSFYGDAYFAKSIQPDLRAELVVQANPDDIVGLAGFLDSPPRDFGEQAVDGRLLRAPLLLEMQLVPLLRLV